ncbi:SDR family oxidoreductase [Halovulum sp. GXIMD14794]
MKTVLVTGAARGMGLEFCRQYSDEGWKVLATVRNVSQPGGLPGIGLEPLPLDTGDDASINALASSLSGVPINLLINNAGIMGDRTATALDADPEQWETAFRINALGPAMVTRALLPNLRLADAPVAATMGSQAGLLRFMGDAGMAVYRSTKAAAHVVTISLAHALRDQDIPYVSLRPGPTRTDMLQGGGQHDIDDSVRRLRQVLADVTMEHSGLFLDRDGSIFPYDTTR